MLAPTHAPWLWAVLVGTATAVFPLVLTLIGLRSRTSAGTAALSGFTQSVGYLFAGIGPFGVGVLYDHTNGWTVPLSALLVLVVPMYLAALVAARPSYIEDQLRR
jgi:CP family cyanate transporter-like MFS transporter